MLLLVVGAEYEEYDYTNKEPELQDSVKYHAKEIFGEDSIFLEKKQLKSLAGIGSVPDGFVVDFKNKVFRIVEVELSSHRVYEHIVNQLTKFINGMRNPDTHKKIVGSIDDELRKQPELRKKIQETIGGEIYRFLDDHIPKQNPSVVVVIDRTSVELDEACGALATETKIVEFRTFVRRNSGDVGIHAHIFEPLTSKGTQKKRKIEEHLPRRRGQKTPEKDYFLPLLETLIEMGGRGKANEVVDKIGEKMKDKLSDFDKEHLPRRSEVRWRNTAEWARNTLKERGLLKRDSPRGIWEITEEGRRYYKEQR